MKSQIILPDTSLCAIVRDEMMNPAGGIVDFADSTVPFVEQAVIVDTGSLDGTREKLEELQTKYSNLVVYDKEFDDYASCRNFSLSKVKTKRALVLDADERLTRADFEKLKELIEKHPDAKMEFGFLYVNPISSCGGTGHNPRLFSLANNLRYENRTSRHFEEVFDNKGEIGSSEMLKTGIQIKHFDPNMEAWECKRRDWYDQVMCGGVKKAPSQIRSFHRWKEFNPRRKEYR